MVTFRELAVPVQRVRAAVARGLPRGRRRRCRRGVEPGGRAGVRLAAGRGGRVSVRRDVPATGARRPDVASGLYRRRRTARPRAGRFRRWRPHALRAGAPGRLPGGRRRTPVRHRGGRRPMCRRIPLPFRRRRPPGEDDPWTGAPPGADPAVRAHPSVGPRPIEAGSRRTGRSSRPRCSPRPPHRPGQSGPLRAPAGGSRRAGGSPSGRRRRGPARPRSVQGHQYESRPQHG